MAKMILELDNDDLVAELVKLRNRATKLMIRSEKMVDDMEKFIHENRSKS